MKIFGDRTLDEISNTRLFRLKQRTLMWRFDIAHLPGSTNTAADAASRHPATSEFFATISGAERDSIDSFEEALLASLRQNTRDDLTLNWDEIARHTASDAALNDLLPAIQSNFDVNFPREGGIRQYLPYRPSMGVMKVMLKFPLKCHEVYLNINNKVQVNLFFKHHIHKTIQVFYSFVPYKK